MTKFEKVEYWIDISEYDMETAAAMLESGRYLYVGFMCQIFNINRRSCFHG
jgi:HEPN domain-containing protein